MKAPRTERYAAARQLIGSYEFNPEGPYRNVIEEWQARIGMAALQLRHEGLTNDVWVELLHAGYHLGRASARMEQDDEQAGVLTGHHAKGSKRKGRERSGR